MKGENKNREIEKKRRKKKERKRFKKRKKENEKEWMKVCTRLKLNLLVWSASLVTIRNDVEDGMNISKKVKKKK